MLYDNRDLAAALELLAGDFVAEDTRPIVATTFKKFDFAATFEVGALDVSPGTGMRRRRVLETFYLHFYLQEV